LERFLARERNSDMTEHPGPVEGEQAEVREQIAPKAWHQGLITARDLQSKTFKPVRIILPGLIPEGVTLLAGKPKVGKSWLALDVCLAVADETRYVLGEMRPVHGDVLYLALEDNQRRLKKRIDKIVQSGTWPKRLELHTEWKRMDQGGLEDIEAWLKLAKEPRLIWIDTLAKVRPIAGRNEQAYTADYRALDGVQKLAGQYGIGVVLNTHLRKAPSEDDPFDEVSGTLGLTAAADTTIVMKRQSGMVKVYVRGRDIEEAEFAAELNHNTCRWRLVGAAEEVFRSQERQAILNALKEAGKGKDGNPVVLSLSDLMVAIERTDREAVRVLLHKMRKARQVVSPKPGYHALPGGFKDPDPYDRGNAGNGRGPDEDLGAETSTGSMPCAPAGALPETVTGALPETEPVTGAVTAAEPAKSLDGHEKLAYRYRVNSVTDFERVPDQAGQHVNGVNGAEHSEPTATVPSDAPVPEVLRRCDHCGQPATAANPLSPYDWPGRPDGVRLHRGCEADWFDSHKPAPGSAPDPAPRQPELVMQDSKEDAGAPPVPPPAMTYDEEVAEIMRRQMPPGDQKRALNKAKNREMTRQFDAGMRAKAGVPRAPPAPRPAGMPRGAPRRR
jgi:AAA domain-containing protein